MRRSTAPDIITVTLEDFQRSAHDGSWLPPATISRRVGQGIVRWFPGFIAAGIVLGIAAASAGAAELVMFEAAGCSWCEAWDRDVGTVYPKTDEARLAPLRRVDIDAPRPPDLAGIRGVVYTPTFVLIDDGMEVGRILGYPGEAHFWGLLGVELGRLETVGGTAPEF